MRAVDHFWLVCLLEEGFWKTIPRSRENALRAFCTGKGWAKSPGIVCILYPIFIFFIREILFQVIPGILGARERKKSWLFKLYVSRRSLVICCDYKWYNVCEVDLRPSRSIEDHHS